MKLTKKRKVLVERIGYNFFTNAGSIFAGLLWLLVLTDFIALAEQMKDPFLPSIHPLVLLIGLTVFMIGFNTVKGKVWGLRDSRW